jgi:hypothetical protein
MISSNDTFVADEEAVEPEYEEDDYPAEEAEEPEYEYDDYREEMPEAEMPEYDHDDYKKDKDPHPDRIPLIIRNRIDFYKEWANDNKKDARNDRIAFWSLKLPAIIISVSSGIFAYFDMQLFTLLGGTIASLCVLIDGLRHPGMLYNVHIQALHDLRELQMKIRTRWQIGVLEDKDRKKLQVEILKMCDKERRRIKDYLMKAETKMGKQLEE